MPILLVIIDNLYIGWPAGPVRPFKANPPLVVDTDAELSFAIARKSLKTIAGQSSEVP